MRRARTLTVLGFACWACGAAPALAAPGDFTIVYDWTNAQTGFAGVAAQLVQPALETPYYQLSEQPGVGLRLTPSISSGGVAERVFPAVDPITNPYGGPAMIAIVDAPPTTQVQSASFSQLGYRRATDENQIMRLALFGPSGQTGFDTRSDAPSPGPFLDDVTYGPANFGTITLSPPAKDANTVQAWLFTSCGDPPAPPACPTVRFPGGAPGSFGQVGRIHIALHDSQAPGIAFSGELAQGGWTNARGARSVQIAATDQGAGIRNFVLQRRRGTSGPFSKLLTAVAACNRNHTGAGEPGRAAAECPSAFQRSFTQPMGALADGEYQYRVTATDDSGLQTVRTFTVRIDRRPPRATFGGAVLGLGSRFLRRVDAVTANAGGTDDRSGVRSIDLLTRADGGGEQLLTSIEVCGAAVACPRQAARIASLALSALPDGEVLVRTVARDAAGNIARASASARLRLDRLAPGKVGALKARAASSQVTVTFTHAGGDALDRTMKVSGLRGYRVTLTDSTFIDVRGVSPVVKPAAGGGHRRIALRAAASQSKDAFVLVQAIDKAGNASPSITAQVLPTRARARPHPLRLQRPRRRTRKPADFGFTDDAWSADREPVVQWLRDGVKALSPPRRFTTLRTIVPYDLWEQEKPDLSAWHEFVRQVKAFNAEAVVVLRSHDFTTCSGGAQAVAFPKPGEPAPGPCTYPASGAEYAKFFQAWLDHTGNGATQLADDDLNRLTVAHWGVWNEPDHPVFTLAWVPKPEGTPKTAPPAGSVLAAQYWISAARGCPHCSVLAGEWSAYKSLWVEPYKRYIADHTRGPGETGAIASEEPPAPSIWTIHAYNALLPGAERVNTVRDYIGKLEEHGQADRLGDFKVWITEIGALLRKGKPDLDHLQVDERGNVKDNTTGLDRHPTLQFAAGRQLAQLDRISSRLQRILYYGALAPSTPAFDDQLADPQGQPRPVLCGMRDRTLDAARCPGNPNTVPLPPRTSP
jgi:hypothetical protein